MAYIVTECPTHGSTEAPNWVSASIYARAAWTCRIDSKDHPVKHTLWHLRHNTSCWVEGECCVVDPYDQCR